MSLRVFWSDRLEEMADKLLGEWSSRPCGSPFERTCVVVGDMATRNWLKDRFLLHAKPAARRVFANIDFTPLPKFVNDWLAASLHGTALRDPAGHPFSKGVMAWRIDAILRAKAGDPDFKTLDDYIAAGGEEAVDRRRFDLATRLAQMFDDYLVSRHATLARWERGKIPSGGDERWQGLLYRELARNATTYADDYEKALAPDFNPETAFSNGFPRYAAVHVFDVMDAPWPYLAMTKRISESIPVTFWTFNPSHDFWLENPTKKQLLRDKAARLRKTLENGEDPEDDHDDPDFSTPDARLLGALATGSRGMLSSELDLTEGDCEWLGNADIKNFAALRSSATEIHACHSPRRELEAARDSLHRFFAENRDTKFSDALVLCADWQKYSPLIEAVFSGRDAAGVDGVALPIATAGISSSTPIAFSFGELLDFRTNRFEVSKVFALLGVPEIRDKFGIDTDGLSTLRDMVKKDNIHWGYDDADVRNILEKEEGGKVGRFHFTWRRGLDRLTLDALLGPREDEDALYDAGEIGRLLPNGNVESERATLVGGLDRFARRLAELRKFLKVPHTAEEWRDGLLKAIDDFYEAKDASLGEVLGLRKAVDAVAAAAIKAREVDGQAPDETIPGDVFCKAATEAVKDGTRKLFSAGDAVRIAPLSNGSAVPAPFIWICGLNDGSFPRNGYRPTFDLIGRHPTMFDVTPRERDALGLLKAAMGARGKLCLSYVGRDIRTNAEIPPAVPLTDLLEWLRASGNHLLEYHHPLQAYSEKYFLGEPDLPPCYSATNHDAAQTLAKARGNGTMADSDGTMVVPFPLNEEGETLIDVDALAEFCGRPNRFLAKRLNITVSNPKYDKVNEDDALDGAPPLEETVACLTGAITLSDEDLAEEAERLVEKGDASERDEIAEKIRAATSAEAIDKFQKLAIEFAKNTEELKRFGCPNDRLWEKYTEYCGRDPEPFPPISLKVKAKVERNGEKTEVEKEVKIVGSLRPLVALTNSSGDSVLHDLVFFGNKPYPSDYVEAWIRHLVRQIVQREETAPSVTALFWPTSVQSLHPVSPDEAESRLQKILELATVKMPIDLKTASGGADKLPEEFSEPLDYDAHLKYKGKRGNKGGAAK